MDISLASVLLSSASSIDSRLQPRTYTSACGTLFIFFSFQTDYEGQAKKLMELMEQTDMLIVAGGDGTLQEVVTGLLRRPDQVGCLRVITP